MCPGTDWSEKTVFWSNLKFNVTTGPNKCYSGLNLPAKWVPMSKKHASPVNIGGKLNSPINKHVKPGEKDNLQEKWAGRAEEMTSS